MILGNRAAENKGFLRIPEHQVFRYSYDRPCWSACITASGLSKRSASAFLICSTMSCGAPLLAAVEATSSLSAGKDSMPQGSAVAYWLRGYPLVLLRVTRPTHRL